MKEHHADMIRLKVQYDEATQKGLGFKYADWDALRDGNKRLYSESRSSHLQAIIFLFQHII